MFLLLGMFYMAKANDSTLTVKQVYEDVKVGIQQLGQKLEGPAKHAYGVYTYQHRAEGVAFACITVFVLSIGSITLFRNLKKAGWDDTDWDRYSTFSIVGIVITFIGLILTITFFADGSFTQIINPEYHAIQDILKTIK